MRNPLDPVVLGPVQISGLEVRLRPAQPADFATWRRTRLRDEAQIAPYWVTDGSDWASQHTEAIWLRKLVDDRDQARAGTALHLAIEVDGTFAGQVDLLGIDERRHAAELGIWTDRELAGRVVGGLAAAMAIDHAFDGIGVSRLTAPASTENRSARTAAQRLGLTLEATMTGYLEVGGIRRDHELWALLRPDRPQPLVDRILDSLRREEDRAEGVTVPVVTLSDDRVVPPTPRAALFLARHRLGRLRDRVAGPSRATPPATPPGSLVVLDAVDTHQRSATLRVLAHDAGADVLVPAVAAVVAEALGSERLRRVSATCDVGDETLVGAFAGAGMHREGTLRDHLDLDGRRGDHELWAATASDRGRSDRVA